MDCKEDDLSSKIRVIQWNLEDIYDQRIYEIFPYVCKNVNHLHKQMSFVVEQ